MKPDSPQLCRRAEVPNQHRPAHQANFVRKPPKTDGNRPKCNRNREDDNCPGSHALSWEAHGPQISGWRAAGMP